MERSRSTSSLLGNPQRLLFLMLIRLLLVAGLEAGVAGKVRHEDFPRGLILGSNQSKAQEETAEGVLLVGHRLGLGSDALLRPCHLTQLADKILRSLGLLRSDFVV